MGTVPLGMAARAVAIQVSQPRSGTLVRSLTVDELPPAYCREVDSILPHRLWSGWIPEVGQREIVRALTPPERRTLESRVAELEKAIVPFQREKDMDRAAVAVLDMYGGFPAMRGDRADAAARVDSVLRLLERVGHPTWAIELGCQSIQENGYERSENGKTVIEKHWPPTDSEICAIVGKAVKLRADALASAKALLAAKVQS